MDLPVAPSNQVPWIQLELRQLRHALLTWYDQSRRELPWRKDTDPYHVWISEIMLQQTRVAAVLEHYARFLDRFPTVQSLAAAREQTVLALWSGLGYYHRARRMHQAAKVIVREWKGEFPRTAEDWRTLPGIGRYTAAAIASIAFGEPVAVLDGNVERVLERMLGRAETKEAAWSQAEVLLSRTRPGDFNQAMMELGATLCTPRSPQCLLCPLQPWCRFPGAGTARPQTRRKRQQLAYALAWKDGSVALRQRPSDATLMAGMWELPSVPEERRGGKAVLARLRHAITDTDYEIHIILFDPQEMESFATEMRWVAPRQWQRLALTGLTRKILRKIGSESGDSGGSSKRGRV